MADYWGQSQQEADVSRETLDPALFHDILQMYDSWAAGKTDNLPRLELKMDQAYQRLSERDKRLLCVILAQTARLSGPVAMVLETFDGTLRYLHDRVIIHKKGEI